LSQQSTTTDGDDHHGHDASFSRDSLVTKGNHEGAKHTKIICHEQHHDE
jgi:hypothetical protein